MKHSVFVYGTLRRGERNHHLLEQATFVKQTIAQPFNLFSVGRFPYILKSNTLTDRIIVELFYIDSEILEKLDALEDYYGKGDPRNLYERILIQDGNGHEGWIYVFCDHKLPVYRPNAWLIPHGDWTKRDL